MVLAERCALLSTEILKSQGKYSDAATLLIKMTSEVRQDFTFSPLLYSMYKSGHFVVLTKLPFLYLIQFKQTIS